MQRTSFRILPPNSYLHKTLFETASPEIYPKTQAYIQQKQKRLSRDRMVRDTSLTYLAEHRTRKRGYKAVIQGPQRTVCNRA
jgi:ribosome modulation factor